jgi:hypothetical protein
VCDVQGRFGVFEPEIAMFTRYPQAVAVGGQWVPDESGNQDQGGE